MAEAAILVFAKLVVLATLSTLRLVFILMKSKMSAAAILNFGSMAFLSRDPIYGAIWYLHTKFELNP